MNEEEEDLVNKALGQITVPQPTANTQQPTQPTAPVTQPAQPTAPVTQPVAPVTQPAQPTAPVTQPAAPTAPTGNNPPPPRAPSEAQRYNSAARAYDTVVNANNPRGLGPSSKIRQSSRNVVPGSLQAKVEADKARGKTDPWTGWGTYHANETRPVLHSIKGKDGTTYYQQVDGRAGTARYWSVDSSGNRTEYTGDDKVSARDQINAARKNADLEAKKNYWRSRGVQFGETDEKGNFTGKFENLTAEGARAEYERKFGKAEEAARVTGDLTLKDELDRQRINWSLSGEGREQYNWKNKLDQSRQVDWNAVRDAYQPVVPQIAAQATGLAARQGASTAAHEALDRQDRTREHLSKVMLEENTRHANNARDRGQNNVVDRFNAQMAGETERTLSAGAAERARELQPGPPAPEPQEEEKVVVPTRMSNARARMIEKYGTDEQKAELQAFRDNEAKAKRRRQGEREMNELFGTGIRSTQMMLR